MPQIDDPTIRLTLNMKQSSTPANPGSGFDKLYFKSDDKLYKKTSGGTESEVGGGGTSLPSYAWFIS